MKICIPKVSYVLISCGKAAYPAIDQGTMNDQTLLLKDLEVAPGVVDSLLELVTSCLARVS